MTPNNTRTNTAQQFTYEDLREWIERADRLGELKRVDGASWEKDMGLAAEVVIREDDGPAVLFDKVPGAFEGFDTDQRVWRRPPQRDVRFPRPSDQTRTVGRLTPRTDRKTIPHVMVDDGPVFENIVTGDDVDLMKFPTPMWRPKTVAAIWVRAPTPLESDEGWMNCGAYRAMIHDKKSVGCFMVTGKHGYVQRNKYWAKGEACPVVMVIGGEPIAFFNGGAEAHAAPSSSISSAASGAKRSNASLARSPACPSRQCRNRPRRLSARRQSEERRSVRRMDRLLRSGEHPEPVLEVEAIYHHNDPIILGVPPMGQGSDEMARYRAVLRSAMLKQNLGSGSGCHRCLVPRNRCVAPAARRVNQTALPRPLQAGRSYRCPVPGRKLRQPLHHRRRRGYRRHQPGTAHLGHVHPLRPGDDHRYRKRRVDVARRSD